MYFIVSFLKEKLKGIPWALLLNVYGIIAIGLYNLYSSTNAESHPERFYAQIIFIVLGSILAILIGLFIDFKSIEHISIVGYIAVAVLLICVDIFGHHSKGAERWLNIGPMRMQPSEFAKLATILIVARSFQMTRTYSEYTLSSLWRQILLIGFLFILIVAQPDLGTASLVLFIGALQIATVKIRTKSIVTLIALGVTLSLLAWNFTLYEYQKQRILTFLNPMLDPRGSGYHSIQSMIAVGSGGLFGLGFGQGTQAKLNFLPERHTDFAFSVWAEEHGFLGCLLIVVLFVILISQIFQVANRARDSFSTLVAVGVGAFFLLHFLINISMVLGMFPVVGVPLSFVSYGGTHMLTALACVGLLIAIERKRVLVTTLA